MTDPARIPPLGKPRRIWRGAPDWTIPHRLVAGARAWQHRQPPGSLDPSVPQEAGKQRGLSRAQHWGRFAITRNDPDASQLSLRRNASLVLGYREFSRAQPLPQY